MLRFEILGVGTQKQQLLANILEQIIYKLGLPACIELNSNWPTFLERDMQQIPALIVNQHLVELPSPLNYEELIKIIEHISRSLKEEN